MNKRAVERPIPIRKPVVEHDVLLGALPHPILVVGDDNHASRVKWVQPYPDLENFNILGLNLGGIGA